MKKRSVTKGNLKERSGGTVSRRKKNGHGWVFRGGPVQRDSVEVRGELRARQWREKEEKSEFYQRKRIVLAS